MFVFFVGLSILLLIADRLAWQSSERIRLGFTNSVTPSLQIFSYPTSWLQSISDSAKGFSNLYQENRRLKVQNARLQEWQQTALGLERENDALRELMHFIPSPKEHYLTARIIADFSDPFQRGGMVSAGENWGITTNEAVVNKDGLVGRTVEIGNNSARIQFITDINARVPVVTEQSRQRVLASGTNTPKLALRYVESDAPIILGEKIITSGDARIFPAGLPVGVITAIDGSKIEVTPLVDFRTLDLVSIIKLGKTAASSSAVGPTGPVKP